jgi:hypothetical protein
MYQLLIQNQPTDDDDIADEEEEIERFNLTASVHFAPSFPLGFYIASNFGFNVSYLTAKRYKENSIESSVSGTVTRIPLKEDIPPDIEDLGLLGLLKLLDWKKISIFKKVTFSDLEKGRYLIKIFRENPLFRGEQQFIGYTIVDLNKDEETRIFCKNEGKVSLSFLNQDNTGIENVQTYLKKDNFIIAYCESDSDGNAIIKAPCGLTEKYLMNVIYKGFLIKEEQIRLGIIRRLLPLNKAFNFDVHDLEIKIRDSEGKTPDFDVKLSLTSEEMYDPVTLEVDRVSNGVYKFNDLYPANYNLKIKYNSYEIIEKIKIPDTDSLEINLYDFTANIKDTWSLSPGAKLDVVLISKDHKKTAVLFSEELSPGEYYFSDIYPGNYLLKIKYKSFTLEEPITIPYGENAEKTIEFPAEFKVKTTVLDSRGNPINNAEVRFSRGGQEIKDITDDKGEVVLLIPPGQYHCKIYSNGELIAKRNVDVLFKKSYSVATSQEPIFPLIVILVTIIFLITAIIISYRRKDLIFFLKILAVLLAIIAIVSPWWNISGSTSNPHFEVSTKLYLVPTEMVTITSNSNVSAGELATLNEQFTEVVNLFPITISVSIFCILANLIFVKYHLKKSSFLTFILAILFFIGSNVVFFIAMSELGKVTVGNFMGSGNIDFSIPGENMYETIPSSWGPDIGFYLLLGSVVVLILSFCLYIKKIIYEKRK